MLKLSKSALFIALPLLNLLLIPLSALAQSTERVSVNSREGQVFWGGSAPDINADGTLIVFQSKGKLSHDTNGFEDVFRRNLKIGITRRVSIGSAEQEGNLISHDASISGGGRFVAFETRSDTLVPNDTNGVGDIFVRDILTGSTRRVSVGPGGRQSNGFSGLPVISSNGRHVAFQSEASNLVPGDTNTLADVFVHDLSAGVTERVSVNSSGAEAFGFSSVPSINADGRYVAFSSDASNLVPDDTNGTFDVFVHDRVSGVTERVSVDSAGNEADRFSSTPSLSADGRFVLFESFATNLVSGDTNDLTDMFIHDRVTGITTRVSVSSSGAQSNGPSQTGFKGRSISANGRHVTFSSHASTLVPQDTNGHEDVFVHDTLTGKTGRVSVSSSGVQGNDRSYRPVMSSDGRHVAFESVATNLVGGDTNRHPDVFVRHLDP